MEGKRINSKLVLFTLVLVLIILLLLNYFLEGNRVDGMWDYKNITTASDIMYKGEKVEDRQIYYTIEGIIVDYINSYMSNQSSEDLEEQKLSYEDYYKYLSKNYRKYLGKSKYLEVSKNFLEKFYVKAESDIEINEYMDTYGLIKQMYSFEDDVYVCQLESGYNHQEGYIAIQINNQNNSFVIMYLE